MIDHLVEIPDENVSVVAFEYRGYDRQEFTTFREIDTKAIVSLIDFYHPLVTEAQPGAIVTGRLIVRLKFGNALIDRSLILYNNELLEDATTFNVFYRADSSLTELIEGLAQNSHTK